MPLLLLAQFLKNFTFRITMSVITTSLELCSYWQYKTRTHQKMSYNVNLFTTISHT